jgi:hypothetical protein
MQRLVDIADKMNREFERFDLVVARRAAQNVAQGVKLDNDAEAAFRILRTIAARTVFAHSQRHIDKMPVGGFRARIASVIGPACDGRQRVAAAEQLPDAARRLRREPPLRNFGNDRMTLLAPSQGLATECYGQDCRKSQGSHRACASACGLQ